MAAETVDDRAVRIDMQTAREALYALRVAQLRSAIDRHPRSMESFERAADAIAAAMAEPAITP